MRAPLRIELINTGTEMLLGRVLNTHQQWICRHLADLGYEVSRQFCVPDNRADLQEAVRQSLGRAALVITTGGLGPTAADQTRQSIAELLGTKLQPHPGMLGAIANYFSSRRRPMPPGAEVQAMVPEGALVLPNLNGTAPGLAISVCWPLGAPAGRKGAKKWLVMLPGPPRELEPMFRASVVPLVQKEFPLESPFVCRVLKTTGLGESLLEKLIAPPLQHLVNDGLELGYCARIGEVDVRLAARGKDAATKIQQGEQILRAHAGPLIYGRDDDTLEGVLVRLLSQRKQTLALAESCTGGFIAHRLTNVPGASLVLLCGLVAYSNHAKRKLLGVSPGSLRRFGAVSEMVARQMAKGARRRCQADYGLAVTGIAGPTGGTPDKPVGTAFIALAGEKKTVVQRQFNPFDRQTFKFVTSQQALELLRRSMVREG